MGRSGQSQTLQEAAPNMSRSPRKHVILLEQPHADARKGTNRLGRRRQARRHSDDQTRPIANGPKHTHQRTQMLTWHLQCAPWGALVLLGRLGGLGGLGGGCAECCCVHAIAQSSGPRPVVEHVAQMRTTPSALHLHSGHTYNVKVMYFLWGSQSRHGLSFHCENKSMYFNLGVFFLGN